MRNRAELTATFFILDSHVLLKCSHRSGLTYSAAMKRQDAPGGQSAALIFTAGRREEAIEAVSQLLCRRAQTKAAISSLRIVLRLFYETVTGLSLDFSV